MINGAHPLDFFIGYSVLKYCGEDRSEELERSKLDFAGFCFYKSEHGFSSLPAPTKAPGSSKSYLAFRKICTSIGCSVTRSVRAGPFVSAPLTS